MADWNVKFYLFLCPVVQFDELVLPLPLVCRVEGVRLGDLGGVGVEVLELVAEVVVTLLQVLDAPVLVELLGLVVPAMRITVVLTDALKQIFILN